jgi:hypothetical protein
MQPDAVGVSDDESVAGQRRHAAAMIFHIVAFACEELPNACTLCSVTEVTNRPPSRRPVWWRSRLL